MSNKFYPCIVIPGLGQSKLEMTDGDGKVKVIWPLRMDGKLLLDRVKKPYAKTVFTRKDKGFSDEIHDMFAEALEPLATMPDGSMKYNIKGVLHEYPASHFTDGEKRFLYRLAPVRELADEIGEDNIYLFSFNFFGDLYESAEQLDRFIGTVREQTGSEKVCLITVSMGGALSTAYFDAYGHKNEIAKVVFIESALAGSVLMADIFKLDVDKRNGYSALEFATSKEMSDAMRVMLSPVPWDIRYAVLYKSLAAAFDTAVNNSLAMWATVPADEYDELCEKHLAGAEHECFRKKLDRFMDAQRNICGILGERQRDGTEFYLCAGYGSRLMALSADGKTSSDSILGVTSMSLGAVSAALGEKLAPDKLSSDSRLSPDGSVDASTGFFRDTTWYIKGQIHNDTCFNGNVQRLVRRAIADSDFKNVFSDPSLPQFTEVCDIRKEKR